MFRITKFIRQTPRNFIKIVESNSRSLATKAAVQSELDDRTEKKSRVKESQSFTMNAFCGKLQTSQVFPFPEPLNEEQTDTIKMLVDPIEKFFEEVNDAAKNDEIEKVDDKTMTALWELGAFAFQVPQEYGGLGLTNTQYSRCVEICGYHDLGVGIVLGAHQSIGFKGILLFGTPEQKAKYLPRVSNGELAAFCLTEPTAGSDASSIRSRAVKSADGSHYILNGSKIWISNGGTADIFTVFAQVPVTDPETGTTRDRMTAFIVERSFGGLSNGPPEKKMGIRCSNTAELFFEDVKIPAENVLGKEGEGFKVAMSILNNGRFGMAAALAGTMRHCIKIAVNHATQRRQFGKTIDNYGTIQHKIARMAMLQYITESLAYTISGNMDTGSTDYHLEAAISKCFSSESAWWVCDQAIQIMGGMGFMKAPGLERIQRDLRIFRIFEGANEVLRLFVALTGCQYAGGHMKELMRALRNPAANFGALIDEATRRASRAFTSVSFRHLVPDELMDHAVECGKDVATFGSAVESSLFKYQKGIVDEQYLLNCFTDIAFDTYTMAVVLSRASMAANKGLPSAEHEIAMAQAWCAEASMRAKHNLKIVTGGKFTPNVQRLNKISRNICDFGGPLQHSPLGF